jgi:hypothetical protein
VPLLVVLIALWGAIAVLVLALCVTAGRGPSIQPPPFVDAPSEPAVAPAAQGQPRETVPALGGEPGHTVRRGPSRPPLQGSPPAL